MKTNVLKHRYWISLTNSMVIKKKPEVSIVIPNYNGKELLSSNLPSVLKAFENPVNNIKEIIIVDDASKDGSGEYLKTNYPQVKVVKHKINRGFSSAVNTGARTARGNLIALLNNDVAVEKDFLRSVFVHFKKVNVFAVSLHEKGYGWAKGAFVDGFVGFEPGTESKKPHDTFWVNGGSGVFRRSVWMKLGGMDENLFSPFYWEDIDISYRAVKRGYRVIWEPGAKVIHEHESTTSKLPKKYKSRIQERNQLLFIWKNITSQRLFRRHIQGLTKRVIRHPGYLLILAMALSKFRKVWRSRRKEKKEEKVADEAIFARY
jgi:GT2 family glycosyltransferase